MLELLYTAISNTTGEQFKGFTDFDYIKKHNVVRISDNFGGLDIYVGGERVFNISASGKQTDLSTSKKTKEMDEEVKEKVDIDNVKASEDLLDEFYHHTEKETPEPDNPNTKTVKKKIVKKAGK